MKVEAIMTKTLINLRSSLSLILLLSINDLNVYPPTSLFFPYFPRFLFRSSMIIREVNKLFNLSVSQNSLFLTNWHFIEFLPLSEIRLIIPNSKSL